MFEYLKEIGSQNEKEMIRKVSESLFDALPLPSSESNFMVDKTIHLQQNQYLKDHTSASIEYNFGTISDDYKDYNDPDRRYGFRINIESLNYFDNNQEQAKELFHKVNNMIESNKYTDEDLKTLCGIKYFLKYHTIEGEVR